MRKLREYWLGAACILFGCGFAVYQAIEVALGNHGVRPLGIGPGLPGYWSILYDLAFAAIGGVLILRHRRQERGGAGQQPSS